MIDAMNGCAMYSYLRRLFRNNSKSRNKVMAYLKSLCKRRGQRDDVEMLRLEESSDDVDQSESSADETTPNTGPFNIGSSGEEEDTDLAEGGSSVMAWIGLLPPEDLEGLNQFFTQVHELPPDSPEIPALQLELQTVS